MTSHLSVWDFREKENHHNSALCRIPEELLVRILHEFQLSIAASDRAYMSIPDLMSIIPTCRCLRSAALSAPELWSYISFGDGHFNPKAALHPIRLCAERSRNCALNLRISLGSMPLPQSHMAEIMKLAPRTRTCELEMGLSTYDSELRNALLSMNWLLLETLDVTNASGESLAMRSSANLVLNAQLLGGRCQTLTTLRSSGVKLSLEAMPLLPQLRHLELEGLHVNHTYREIRHFLSRTTQLRSLKLQFHSFNVPDRALMPGLETPLHLPHLRVLHLSGLPSACLYMTSILSDSYRELKLDIQCKKWMERDRDWHHQLFIKALNFADQRRPGEPALLIQHRCVYKRLIPPSEVISQPVIELSPTSSPPINATSRILVYRVMNHVSMPIFTQISEFVTELHCETDVHHARVFSTFSSPRCTIQVLKFTEWKARWMMYTEQTVALKRALARLKEHRGVPLQVLWVDSAPADAGVEKQWLKQGLVQSVRYSEINGVDRRVDKKPDSAGVVVPLTYRSFDIEPEESLDYDLDA